jgi:hypothetical protein
MLKYLSRHAPFNNYNNPMKKTINIKWELKKIQDLVDKINEMKKEDPELLEWCTIIIEVEKYTIKI